MGKGQMDAGGKQFRIVFFGDSICVGQGVSIHKGWVTRLSALVEAIGREYHRDIVIVNASVNGNTTRMALERMPYDVQSHGVDLLLVQFGLNDCNYWLSDRGGPRVSERAFEANLHEIIDRGMRFGARQIVLNTNHPTTRDTGPFPGTNRTYEQSNRAYNRIIRRVAKSRPGHLSLNDVEKHFLRQVRTNKQQLSELLLDDQLHLSEAGHDAYYRITEPLVEHAVRGMLRPSPPKKTNKRANGRRNAT